MQFNSTKDKNSINYSITLQLGMPATLKGKKYLKKQRIKMRQFKDNPVYTRPATRGEKAGSFLRRAGLYISE